MCKNSRADNRATVTIQDSLESSLSVFFLDLLWITSRRSPSRTLQSLDCYNSRHGRRISVCLLDLLWIISRRSPSRTLQSLEEATNPPNSPFPNVYQPFLVPSPASRPLQIRSKFLPCSPYPCLPPTLVVCRVASSSYLATHSLPTPYTGPGSVHKTTKTT